MFLGSPSNSTKSPTFAFKSFFMEIIWGLTSQLEAHPLQPPHPDVLRTSNSTLSLKVFLTKPTCSINTPPILSNLYLRS